MDAENNPPLQGAGEAQAAPCIDYEHGCSTGSSSITSTTLPAQPPAIADKAAGPRPNGAWVSRRQLNADGDGEGRRDGGERWGQVHGGGGSGGGGGGGGGVGVDLLKLEPEVLLFGDSPLCVTAEAAVNVRNIFHSK